MTDDEISAFVATLRRSVLLDVEIVLRKLALIVGEHSPPAALDLLRVVDGILERVRCE